MSLFRFKQFSVAHQNSSMKVGTDAVLLGAIAGVSRAKRILDVGTGCGVIALALAQRTEAEIYAIDIDQDSVQEAMQNFKNSPWNDRVSAKEISFQEFAETNPPAFDVVVSNPPFFQNALRSPADKRNIARHNSTLTFDDFAKACKNVLTPEGKAWVILPLKESWIFTRSMMRFGFRDFYRMQIHPKSYQPANRVILGFASWQDDVIYEDLSLTIRNGDGAYTDSYKQVTAEFYIHF